MSGLFSQVGFANETITPPASTVGTSAVASVGVGAVNTLTFGSAHGLVAGSVMVLTGFTPAGWNGTWVVYTVPSATTLTFFTPTTLATPVTVFGTISASVYGSQVSSITAQAATITPAPSRFTTFVKESLKGQFGRIESAGMGANRRYQSSTRGVIDRQGAAGDLQFELESKGFGFWLKHLVGPVVTTGPSDSAFTHTASPPTTTQPPGMLGTSFNFQGTVVPVAGTSSELVKTYRGCKVVSWQLDFGVGQICNLTVNIDAQDELYNIVKATASYSTTPELLSFAGGVVQIAGTTWDVVRLGSIKCDLGYNAERRFVAANTLQREPAEEKMRVVTVELDGEFDNALTVYNKVATNTYSQTMAQLNLAFSGKILIGVTTFPSLTFNIPVARFDGDTPVTEGMALPTQHLTAKAMDTGMTAAYVTTDSTP